MNKWIPVCDFLKIVTAEYILYMYILSKTANGVNSLKVERDMTQTMKPLA